MESSAINQFFLRLEEPQKGCFMALRQIILNWNPVISEHWKYKVPFYYYNGKPFCYLWKDKKTNEPYIGMVKGDCVDHYKLEKGNRKKMKIMRINPSTDIEVGCIYEIFEELKKHY